MLNSLSGDATYNTRKERTIYKPCPGKAFYYIDRAPENRRISPENRRISPERPNYVAGKPVTVRGDPADLGNFPAKFAGT